MHLLLQKLLNHILKMKRLILHLHYHLSGKQLKLIIRTGMYILLQEIFIYLVNDGSKAIHYYNQAQFADPQSPTANMKIGNIYVKGAQSYMLQFHILNRLLNLMQIMLLLIVNLDSYICSPRDLTSQKSISKNILILLQVIFLQRPRYVNALFYAKDYDGVIKNVEEIFAVDKSRTYMNRIAGYSCYEKTPPDYDKALHIWRHFSKQWHRNV